jgi:hypothetical protein
MAAMPAPRARAQASASDVERSPAPAPAPVFDELSHLEPSEVQEWLVRDIGRRRAELVALGWLGRAYLAVPALFQLLAPRVFELQLYEAHGDSGRLEELVYATDETVDCVLAEGSVVQRGVPLRLRLMRAPTAGGGQPWTYGGSWASAELLAVGCDLTPEWPQGARLIDGPAARSLCQQLNADRSAKRLIVRAIVRAVFEELEPLFAPGASPLASSGTGAELPFELEPCGPVVPFEPRRDLFAREGSSEKWLQRVSAYYFARSKLRDVRIVGSRTGVRFCFYLDPEEPPNSLDALRNVNPEVLCCKFRSYFMV